MRILVLGTTGQLGHELMRAVWPEGWSVTGLPYPEFDLTRAGEVERTLEAHPADIVINATAHTAVDKAESEADLAYLINRDGPRDMADFTARRGIPLIHVSTDYVFDGTKPTPYTEDDPVNPMSVYGASKAAGDEAVRSANPRHVILRTSWVYAAFGHNFIKTMLRLGREREEVGVVADQHGSPTSAADLAEGIVHVARRVQAGGAVPWGTYHLTGGGETTWHGLAERIFQRLERQEGRRPRLKPLTSAEFPTPVRRPTNSRLDNTRFTQAFGYKAPDWAVSLERVLDELLEPQAAVSP